MLNTTRVRVRAYWYEYSQSAQFFGHVRARVVAYKSSLARSSITRHDRVVEEVDELIGQRPGHWRPFGGTHPARRNRSVFVRLAIVEKLERDKKLNT